MNIFKAGAENKNGRIYFAEMEMSMSTEAAFSTFTVYI